MEIGDGRGQYMKPVQAKNRAKIKKWYSNNPGGTMMECSKATGFSYPTVRNHTAVIRAELETLVANAKRGSWED